MGLMSVGSLPARDSDSESQGVFSNPAGNRPGFRRSFRHPETSSTPGRELQTRTYPLERARERERPSDEREYSSLGARERSDRATHRRIKELRRERAKEWGDTRQGTRWGSVRKVREVVRKGADSPGTRRPSGLQWNAA
jgi:hypothetical protein